MFKRWNIVLVIIMAGVLILSACAPKNAESAKGIPQFGCLGTADKALVDLKCREVTIGEEDAYLPFNFIDSKTNKAGGWDYEVLPEICTRLHCKPVFMEVSWDAMIQSVSDGLYDMGGDGITINDERKQIIDFSMGYLNIQQRLLARKGETRYKSIEDFAANDALILGTQSGTTNMETALKFLPEARVKGFEQFPFAIQALISGDIDAVILDEVIGLGYVGTSADKVELVGPSIESNQLGFIFPKGSPLVEPFNKAIQSMIDDGFLNTINKKYFGPDFKVTYGDIKEITYPTPVPTK
jgi:polar amino acid transport system substrate-binding protein